MVKLSKYLRPFFGLIFLAVLLLFVQAMTDLALPDYMSNIVNKGIQQGGIENAVPKAIRKSHTDKLTIFMSESQRNEVVNSYQLIEKSNEKFGKYVKLYPRLAQEPIFVLKDIDRTKIEELNPIIGKALLTVSGIEQMKAESKTNFIDINGKQFPVESDVFTLLKDLPIAQRLQISEEITKRHAILGENMIVQAAIGAVKAEYKALEMNIDKIQNRYIIRTGMIMLLISIISAICIVGVGFLGSRVAAGLSRNLRREVFAKVLSFSKVEMDKFSTASLITRTTNDITQIQMLVVVLIRTFFFAPIMGIGGIIRALDKSSSMSWIIAIAVAALMVLIAGVFIVALPKFKAIQKLVDRLNLVARENLSGIMVIRAFNTQSFEETRFDEANRDLTNTNLFVNRVMAFTFPSMTLIMNFITLLIIWVGAKHIANSSMQIGDMMAFMQYVMQIIFSFLRMSLMFILIPRASVAAQRIAEVLDTETNITDSKDPIKFGDDLNGVVEFKNVSFKYDGAEKYVLKNINFKALPGKTTAIIGSTGSGKTTLVNLIPRFYDVTKGQVLIDGVDVRDVTQFELRDIIGYVPQQSSLFSGTIESNLKYARGNATTSELEEASKTAQAMDFIREKPDGFDSVISQGGTNVSGGQKQRLSIARALVKNPKIYIFDDSFSALDFKTDAALRKALKEKTESSTIILVAQRISTIMRAEQIIVLDRGRIVGKGTHDQLIQNCKTYQEIALSQLTKEELA